MLNKNQASLHVYPAGVCGLETQAERAIRCPHHSCRKRLLLKLNHWTQIIVELPTHAQVVARSRAVSRSISLRNTIGREQAGNIVYSSLMRVDKGRSSKVVKVRSANFARVRSSTVVKKGR